MTSGTSDRTFVDTYAPWCVEGITTNDLSAAFRIEDQARVGSRDALIIAVAARSAALRLPRSLTIERAGHESRRAAFAAARHGGIALEVSRWI